MLIADRDFRTALALNNMGVALLQNACYEQAILTFQDAVLLMKQTCRGEKAVCFIDADTKLREANQRIARPQQSNVVDWFPVSVRSSSDDPTREEMDATLESRPFTNDAVYAIRFDSIGMDQNCELDASVSCDIILQNFALAHLCFSQCVDATRARGIRKKGLN